jgi:hypothetical protein
MTSTTDHAHPFPAARDLAERAFERLVPRTVDGPWLELVTAPAEWEWDLETIQRGFTDPLYGLYDTTPDRLRPTLAAHLLAAAGVDPEAWAAPLVSLELLHLASIALNQIRNGRTVADATSADSTLPMPVIATMAYTARQLATYLPTRHLPELPSDEARLWLAYRFSHVLHENGVGGALEVHSTEAPEPPPDPIFEGYLKLKVAPLSFQLPVDCATAALGIQASPQARVLRDAAAAAGIAHRLAANLISLANRIPGRAQQPIAPEPRVVCLWASLPGELSEQRWRSALTSGLAGRALRLAERARARVDELLGDSPPRFAEPLAAFVAWAVDPMLRDARTATA